MHNDVSCCKCWRTSAGCPLLVVFANSPTGDVTLSRDSCLKLESWLRPWKAEKLSETATSFSVTKQGNLTDRFGINGLCCTICNSAVHWPAESLHLSLMHIHDNSCKAVPYSKTCCICSTVQKYSLYRQPKVDCPYSSCTHESHGCACKIAANLLCKAMICRPAESCAEILWQQPGSSAEKQDIFQPVCHPANGRVTSLQGKQCVRLSSLSST